MYFQNINIILTGGSGGTLNREIAISTRDGWPDSTRTIIIGGFEIDDSSDNRIYNSTIVFIFEIGSGFSSVKVTAQETGFLVDNNMVAYMPTKDTETGILSNSNKTLTWTN